MNGGTQNPLIPNEEKRIPLHNIDEEEVLRVRETKIIRTSGILYNKDPINLRTRYRKTFHKPLKQLSYILGRRRDQLSTRDFMIEIYMKAQDITFLCL